MTTAGRSIDLAGFYRLRPGLRVVQRPGGGIQLGTEPPDWLLLHQPPDEALDVLHRLDGRRALGRVLSDCGAEPAVWSDLFVQLLDAGLLSGARQRSPVTHGRQDHGAEHLALVHRYGPTVAERLLQLRADAAVVVRGSGRVAIQVTSTLLAAGVGTVQQQSERAIGRSAAGPASGPRGRRSAPSTPSGSASGRSDRRRATPEPPPVSTAAFAPDRVVGAADVGDRTTQGPPDRRPLRPALVVLAGQAPEPPWEAAELVRSGLPHLAVRAQLGVAVVGPLVLPGRSTCLLCVVRHRTARDAGWPAVEAALRQDPVVPASALGGAAAVLASTDALTFLDGLHIPATVDGTLEWRSGDVAPRRRSWSPHPECDCGANWSNSDG